MIKGGVSKKNHRRRTVDGLAVPSPASSNVFLLRLKNNGNFCYSNAAVTCILGNPLIKQFILEENGTPGGPLSQLKTLLGTQIDQVHICLISGYRSFVVIFFYPLYLIAGWVYRHIKAMGDTKESRYKLCGE